MGSIVTAKPINNKNNPESKAPLPEEHKCFECNKMEHLRRNCPEYLAKQRMNKANGVGPSGFSIYVIEHFTASNNTWVFALDVVTTSLISCRNLKSGNKATWNSSLVMGKVVEYPFLQL
ncbi:hypothetical protein E3N88_33053 [Mikania micrantha]|uniref:CCHC-type domain-containing protein n=1 Tax=Mikania micrantha TaxID=192012 RepID=A0A5N6MAW1_9ASTR|nr:hypothetical protein E3N88_33053 [Mikania micrantha]